MIVVIFMILWTASYSFGWAHSFPRMSTIHWHAHEMLYGYAMAVIARFLLTKWRFATIVKEAVLAISASVKKGSKLTLQVLAEI